MLASREEPIGAFASRAYAAKLRKGCALGEIDWIAWPEARADLAPNPQLAARIPSFEAIFSSNDFLVQLRAAESGAGALILARRTSRLAPSSDLVQLDVDLGQAKVGMHLVCARSSLQIPRVRAVADLLAIELSDKGRVARRPTKPSASG